MVTGFTIDSHTTLPTHAESQPVMTTPTELTDGEGDSRTPNTAHYDQSTYKGMYVLVHVSIIRMYILFSLFTCISVCILLY